MSGPAEASAFLTIIAFASEGIKVIIKACELVQKYQSVDHKAESLFRELQRVVKGLSRVQYLASQSAASGVSYITTEPLHESIAQCQATARHLEMKLPTGPKGTIPRGRKLRLLIETEIFQEFHSRVSDDRQSLIIALSTFSA